MKNGYLKLLSIIIVILSIPVFLWNSFMMILGIESEHRDLQINDYNRETIDKILSRSIDTYSEIPDISNATKIEYSMLMDEDRGTIYYEDKSVHMFYIERSSFGDNLFIKYMKENGSNFYFRSSDFIIHLVKVIITFSILVVFIVISVRKKLKKFLS